MKYIIETTKQFKTWYKKQNLRIKRRVDARLARIEELGDLGFVRYLGNKLFELKWKTGIRVYFIINENKIILLLHGGKKNDQTKDIQKAKKLQKEYS